VVGADVEVVGELVDATERRLFSSSSYCWYALSDTPAPCATCFCVTFFKALNSRNRAEKLETFAYGNMSPNAQPWKDNARYGDAMRLRNQEKLLAQLNDAGNVVFETYIDASEEVN